MTANSEIQQRSRAAAERLEALVGPDNVTAVVPRALLLEAASLLRGYHQVLLLSGPTVNVHAR